MDKKITKDTTEKKERNTKAIALLITTLLLLGVSAYLFIDNQNTKELNTQQIVKIDSLTTIKAQLEKELASIKTELESIKLENITLDSTLKERDNEIALKVEKITRLLQQSRDVTNIKKELAELRVLKDQHLAEIEALKAQLAAAQGKIDTLVIYQKDLEQQVSTLTGVNTDLTKKVEIASILRVENVLVIGEKKSKSGKYAPTKLKKANRFLVTFDLAENKIAAPGARTIYVTITDPAGTIIQTPGSGTFMNDDQNLSAPYTEKHEVSYGGQTQKIILPVELDENVKDRKPGNYKLEFYCDKYLAGTKTLTLK